MKKAYHSKNFYHFITNFYQFVMIRLHFFQFCLKKFFHCMSYFLIVFNQKILSLPAINSIKTYCEKNPNSIVFHYWNLAHRYIYTKVFEGKFAVYSA